VLPDSLATYRAVGWDRYVVVSLYRSAAALYRLRSQRSHSVNDPVLLGFSKACASPAVERLNTTVSGGADRRNRKRRSGDPARQGFGPLCPRLVFLEIEQQKTPFLRPVGGGFRLGVLLFCIPFLCLYKNLDFLYVRLYNGDTKRAKSPAKMKLTRP